jgi:hypothetical protein
MVAFTKTGKLCNDLCVIMICLASFTSKEGHKDKFTFFCFSAAFYVMCVESLKISWNVIVSKTGVYNLHCC